MSSNIRESKMKLMQAVIDLRVHASSLGIAADREKRLAALRANANSELKALKELKVTFEPEFARLAEIDLTHLRNSGANVEPLDDAKEIIVLLDESILANEQITSGQVSAETLLDVQQPFLTAAAIQARIETLIEAVVKLSA